MDARFSFEVDPSCDFVRITMGGLFSLGDIADFIEARYQAHRQLQCGPNAHVTLNDLRELKIQPQETVAAFREMLAAPDYRSRRLAFVAGQTLARNQLLRALGSRDARCFGDPITAEAWLFRSDEVPARRTAAG